MVTPAQALRIGIAWLIAALVLVTTGCETKNADDQKYVVSYSGAAHQLDGMAELEATEQLRDWARLGLASRLGLRHDQLVDALYDTIPVRDPIYTGLVEQPTGPGRGLFDGTTLHVLVPDDDRHRARTIGEVLDEHRGDAGADAKKAQVHRYRLLRDRKVVELVSEPVTETAEVRVANGWHESRVDQPGGVADFLAATDRFSRLESRGTEVWAGGWRWPDTPDAAATAQVTAEDVAVLQRGYRNGSLPGFSLDPQPVSSLADVRATVPDLAPRIAEAITSGNWAGTGYTSAAEVSQLVGDALFQEHQETPAGLPADRTQLWALHNLMAGGPVYSMARYDGGLAGTEAGMTLFYVDLVTKQWITGVGTGMPTEAVPGFVPDPQVPTPESLCAAEPSAESGRLWFGQADAGFHFSRKSVDIGAHATRLFSRSNSADGTEVEPSYSFGRGLAWFDRHFQDIADHEVQFHRLDNLMRWAGALEWLSANGVRELPVSSDVREDLRFAGWYVSHDELRERTPLALVAPPSASEEAVLPTPSSVTKDCGFLQIKGGVSLADGYARGSDGFSGADALPPGMRRNGPTDPAATHVDPETGAASVRYVAPEGPGKAPEQLRTTVWRGESSSSAHHTGRPSDAVPFAGAPFRDANPAREATTEIRSGESEFVVHQSFEGIADDTVRVSEPATSGVPHRTEISARPGHVDRMMDVASRVAKDPEHGVESAPGWLYSYESAGQVGQTIHRFDTGWFEIGAPSPVPTGKAVQVQTPNGVIEVRAVVPRQLSPADLSSTRVLGEGTVQAGKLAEEVPAGANHYTDNTTLLSAEPGKTLPEAIPATAKVHFVVVQPVGERGASGRKVGGDGRTWSLFDSTTAFGNSGGRGGSPPGTGGSPPGAGGPPDGPGGSSGGGRLPIRWGGVLGWQVVVLVTVCSDASQDEEEPAGCL